VSQLPPSPGHVLAVSRRAQQAEEEEDLPPPYSENPPPVNPFYNQPTNWEPDRDAPHHHHRRSDSSLLLVDSAAAAAMRSLAGEQAAHSSSLPGPFLHPFANNSSPHYPLRPDGLGFGQVISGLSNQSSLFIN
jgi:hypothetical protein